MRADLLIEEVTIVDGTGQPCFSGYVAVKDDTIVKVGSGVPSGMSARQTYCFPECLLCPGFIDIHGHSDLALLHEPAVVYKLAQGVTTEVIGNCGLTVAPLSGEERQEWVDYLGYLLGDYPVPWCWDSFDAYLEKVEAAGPGVNVVPLVGHCAIRAAVMGFCKRQPSAGEMQLMKQLLTEAMERGVFGVSFGLGYPPGGWADQQEMEELASVVATYDGVCTVHMRNYSRALSQAVNEVLNVGRNTGCRMQISHFQAGGRDNWGTVDFPLADIARARDAGQKVLIDMYPYCGGSGYLSAFLPLDLWEGGPSVAWKRLADPRVVGWLRQELSGIDWSIVTIRGVRSDWGRDFMNCSIEEVADRLKCDPVSAMARLLVAERGKVLITALGNVAEADLRQTLISDFCAVCSDGLPAREALPHPRTYGAFSRFISRYVFGERLVSVEEGVRRCCSLAADQFGLVDRGRIAEGAKADLVVIDPGTIDEGATHEEPLKYPQGFRLVVVNGQVVIEDGKLKPIRAGRVLRRAVKKCR
ncbi:MAG: N-acyl-D-amino-acid deacylase family protein [Bacillota bacterium]